MKQKEKIKQKIGMFDGDKPQIPVEEKQPVSIRQVKPKPCPHE